MISQRLDYFEKINEYRNCIDNQWFKFLDELNIIPIIIPNYLPLVQKMIQSESNIDGILLTGGNDIGSVPQRDETELFLLEYGIKNNIPILGICRGMQMIQHYFGISLEPVSEQVTPKQTIIINNFEQLEVNSYHNFGTTQTNEYLNVWGKSLDGVVKAVKHKNHNVTGIMWHPERNQKFSNFDKSLFQNIFNLNN